MKDVLTHRSTVQQWECDHMGHMNVRHYMAKFDDAAWAMLAELGINKSYFKERNGGVAAVDHHVMYKRELVAGDSVIIHTQLVLFAGKKFKMRHEMTHAITKESVASCELFGVHLDQQARKAVNFPEDLVEVAQKFLCVDQAAAQ